MRFIAYAVGSVLIVASAKATIIYDDTGSGSSKGDPIDSFGPLYNSFTSPISGTISSLEVELSNPGGAGTITAGLYSDSSTSPGSLIATLGTLDDTTIGTSDALYVISLLSEPALAAGTRYWIGLSDTGSVDWAYTPAIDGTGVAGEYYKSELGVYPNSIGGPYIMQLGATPSTSSAVPDTESTLTLLVFAFSGMLFFARRIYPPASVAV